MGCVGSQGSTGSSEEVARAKKIDEQLLKERKKQEIKLLLLGAGESGKTTFLKQMKIINLNGYSLEERMQFNPVIISNIKMSMKALVAAAKKLTSSSFLEENLKYAEMFVEGSETLEEIHFSHEVGCAISSLWKDPLIQSVWNSTNEWDFLDTAPYFFETIEKIAVVNYVPSIEDILRCRIRTTGISEVFFPLRNEARCRMVDVGGQRSERRKWIHCFHGVTAVLFFVSLNEFDQMLQEAAHINRMHESLKLFDEVCNCRWFTKTSVVLFFNKNDLFKEKIKRVDLKLCFPEYSGGHSYQAAVDYIKAKFIELNQNKDRSIYVHFTCATDTDNIRKVSHAVLDIIMDSNLQAAGFGGF